MIPEILTKENKQKADLLRHHKQALRQADAAIRRTALNKEKREKQKARETKRINSLRRSSHSRRTSKSSKGKNKEELSPRATKIKWRNQMGNNRTLVNINPYTSPSHSPPSDIRSSQHFNSTLQTAVGTPYNSIKTFNKTSKSPRMIRIHRTHGNRPPPMNSNELLEAIRNIVMKSKVRYVMRSSSKLRDLLRNAESKGLFKE
jgi:hypothetical protein